jgi:hypothetical protein
MRRSVTQTPFDEPGGRSGERPTASVRVWHALPVRGPNSSTPKSRHESDDLDVLSRMLDPEEELEAAEQALAAS